MITITGETDNLQIAQGSGYGYVHSPWVLEAIVWPEDLVEHKILPVHINIGTQVKGGFLFTSTSSVDVAAGIAAALIDPDGIMRGLYEAGPFLLPAYYDQYGMLSELVTLDKPGTWKIYGRLEVHWEI